VLWGRLYNFEFDDIVEDQLASSGVTARTETSRNEYWYMTRAGVAYVPMGSVGLSRHNWKERQLIEPPPLEQTVGREGARTWERSEGCWNADHAVSKRLQHWVSEHKHWAARGVLAYNMGDERATSGMCLHPACWKTYLDYLQRQYGSIDALNVSWGTSFQDFAEIEPVIDKSTLPSRPAAERLRSQMMWANLEAASRGPTPGSSNWNEDMRNYPRWFDRQAFGRWNFCKYVHRFKQAVSSFDPHAKVGLEGTGWIDDDVDWYVRNTDWWLFYSTLPMEVVRSIAPRIAPQGYTFGQWTGGRAFWNSFCRGANCVGQWRVDHYLGPDYNPNGEVRRTIQTARVIFDGLGRLLNIESKIQHDGIVMLHSFPSAQAASFLEAGPSYGKYNGMVSGIDDHTRPKENENVDWTLTAESPNNHLVWHWLIRAAGLQFDYTTDRMMRLGEFDPAPYKVMILSQCEAIGEQEAQIIRDFVAGGGTVVADIRPGLYDNHCRPLQGGALDDVFGVRHSGNVPAVEASGAISGKIDGHEVSVQFRRIHVNPAIETMGDSTALGTAGQTPICIVNRFGNGTAILFNFAMWSFPNVWSPTAPRGALELLESIFASAGVEWPLRLLDADGNPFRQVEAVRWKTGEGIEVVVIRGPLEERYVHPIPGIVPVLGETDTRLPVIDKSPPVHIRLPASKYAVEIGTGTPTDRTTELVTEHGLWWPALIVLSDKPLHAPTLTAQQGSVKRGGILQLQVEIPNAQGLHAVKLRARDPDGEEAPWFSRSLIVEEGIAKVPLHIAHNERNGKWTVTATDLYTGESCVVPFVVE